MNLKSRKLMVAGICFGAASVFVALGKADFTGWSEFIKWVLITYMAGNVGEHVASKK